MRPRIIWYINGSFLNEGLIDELSLVIAPVTDCASDTVTLFERADYLPEKAPVEFSLLAVEKLPNDGIWLRYNIKRISDMETRKLGDLEVSAIGMGCMNLSSRKGVSRLAEYQ